jgi:SAM-dependent methyltransferase
MIADFSHGLRGNPCALRRTDGVLVRLPVRRWHAPASGADRWLLDRCTGPTLDLGCGPGRLVTALGERGLPALGVDVSPDAVSRTLSRGGTALRRDVLGRLPAEGRWAHVLLADGNIGIGGNPARLLHRAKTLLQPGGTVLVELDPTGGLWCGAGRLEGVDTVSPWFPWAQGGRSALPLLAAGAGLAVTALRFGRRTFAELSA